MTPLSLLPKVRSKAIMASARGQPCSLRLPGYCNHNVLTTVCAHLPGIGKGTGTKVSDLHVAYMCSECHRAMDLNLVEQDGTFWKWVLRAHCETQARMVEAGIITVPDGETI